MAFVACHKHAQISARKVRPLADMVRGKFADEALNILRYQPSRVLGCWRRCSRAQSGMLKTQSKTRVDRTTSKNSSLSMLASMAGR